MFCQYSTTMRFFNILYLLWAQVLFYIDLSLCIKLLVLSGHIMFLLFFLPTCFSSSTCPTALFSYVFVSVLRPFFSAYSSLLIRLFSWSDSGRCLILNCSNQRLIGRPVRKRKKKKTAVSEHRARAFF